MATTEDLQTLVLTTLDKSNTIEDSKDLTFNDAPVDQLALLGALNSLKSKEMIDFTPIERISWTLTEEGKQVAKDGSHEARVFGAIPAGDEGLAIAELQAKFGASAKAGQGKAFKNKWISKKGNNLIRLVDSIVDETQKELKEIEATGTLENQKTLAELKKRTLIDKQYDSHTIQEQC
ncbi:hypothetical protein G6F42_020299 [Rhizopus arrhizus]|nr:hypothetical protein G6F42_020299 [Rhizopus arrhizus]